MFKFGSKKAVKLSSKSMSDYNYEGDRPEGSGDGCDLENWFWNHEGQCVHKWHHYLPIYQRYFEQFRNKPIRMLEIGVSWGGSLDMWREFFGDEAIIYGIDIDPKCARYNGKSGQVRIGSQDDTEFLASVLEEMGGIDIILDDGSHKSGHIRTSFDFLYPKLSVGGLYMIEDLHTNYWKNFQGGYKDKRSFLEVVKTIIDDMHHWYHDEKVVVNACKDTVAAMHVHDSIVVFEKEIVTAPRHTQRGIKQ